MPNAKDSKYGSNIKIKGENEFIEKAEIALDEIYATEVGKTFLADLQSKCKAADKKVTIYYREGRGNSCAGGGDGQYISMVQKKGSQGDDVMGEEVQKALKNANTVGVTLDDIARRLYTIKKPTLSPRFSFKDPYDNSITPGDNMIAKTKEKIQSWTIKDALGKEKADLYESFLVVMQDWWEPGTKVSAYVTFDPSKTSTGGQERPVSVALFHELVHAFYSVQGRQLGIETPPSSTNTLYEGMCVGLPPHFHDNPYSENKFRAALSVPLREYYGTGDEPIDVLVYRCLVYKKMTAEEIANEVQLPLDKVNELIEEIP